MISICGTFFARDLGLGLDHCPSSSALTSSGVWVTKDKAWIRGLGATNDTSRGSTLW